MFNFKTKQKNIWNSDYKKYSKQYTSPYGKKNIDNNNIILTKNVALGLDTKQTKRNLNVMTIGAAGSGLTRSFIIPNLLQANSSYIVVDINDNIYYKTNSFFKEQGYIIKKLDLVNPRNSNKYNPFKYIHNDTELLTLIDIIMKNTRGKEELIELEKIENLLLNAIISYVYKYNKSKNFKEVIKLLKSAELDDIFMKLKDDELCKKQYLVFLNSAKEKRNEFIISCCLRLSLFELIDLQRLTNNDEMEIDSIDDKKTIIYINLSSFNNTNNLLAIFFIEQIFNTLFYNDENKKMSKENVTLILDEFCMIGYIPNIHMYLAISRKYNLNVFMTCNDVCQLKSLYPDYWEALITNCDSLLYLGVFDIETNKYISNFLGIVSIKHKESTYLRNRCTIDEMSMLDKDKCILIIRGLEPFYDNKYKIETHKNYKFINE